MLSISLLMVSICGFTKETSKNKRFPAEKYFMGKRLEMGKAIYQNDKNKVKELLEKGIDVNEKDEQGNGFTYLMYSVFLDNRFDIAKILLQNKANPNLISRVLFDGDKKYTYLLPLTVAVEDMPIDYMKLLLEYGAAPNYAYVDEKGRVPLNADYAIHRAVHSSYILWKWEREDFMNDIKARVELLLSYGASLATKDGMGYTVYENARTNPEILLYLMNKNPNSLEYGSKLLRMSKNSLKVSAEHLRSINEEIIRRLVELGYQENPK